MENDGAQIGAVTATTARALLRLRGDTASRSLAELLVRRYEQFGTDHKIAFCRLLLDDFGADRARVDTAIAAYQQSPSEEHMVALAEAADSARLALFRAANTTPVA